MLVVADASPINFLIRIGNIEVLERMFGRIFIPPAVAQELSHPNTPGIVREWFASRPSWVEIRAPSRIDPDLPIDLGESEAISLVRELGADLLLVDDFKARRVAARLGLEITGTLGVLESAARRGLLHLPDAIRRLRQTDFRISDRLLEDAIRRDAQYRASKAEG